MSRNKRINANDYCYACVAVSSTGQEHICGFSRTFEGLKDVREAYIGACEEENIEGMTFTTPLRWSRKEVVQFFRGLKERNVHWAYLLHGFVIGEEKMYVRTPDDIDSFLTLKDLYADEC